MPNVVKKTISLPSQIAKEIERIAKEENKSISAVIVEALELIKQERLKKEFYQIQGFWSKKAKEKGILTEEDLKKYLKNEGCF